jgi:hypothetical protein
VGAKAGADDSVVPSKSVKEKLRDEEREEQMAADPDGDDLGLSLAHSEKQTRERDKGKDREREKDKSLAAATSSSSSAFSAKSHFVFDRALVLPEFLVSFDYVRDFSAPPSLSLARTQSQLQSVPTARDDDLAPELARAVVSRPLCFWFSRLCVYVCLCVLQRVGSLACVSLFLTWSPHWPLKWFAARLVCLLRLSCVHCLFSRFGIFLHPLLLWSLSFNHGSTIAVLFLLHPMLYVPCSGRCPLITSAGTLRRLQDPL